MAVAEVAGVAARPDVLVILLRVYFDGEKSVREAVRWRALSFFGHDPNATLANELGEVIPQGG